MSILTKALSIKKEKIFGTYQTSAFPPNSPVMGQESLVVHNSNTHKRIKPTTRCSRFTVIIL